MPTLWTRYESWTVDARGVVRWAARWENPIVTCVPAAGGFAVAAGSGLYRFGGGEGVPRGVPNAVAGHVLGGAELGDPAESPAKTSPGTGRTEAAGQAEKANGDERARLEPERLPAKVVYNPPTTTPRNRPTNPGSRRSKLAAAARDGRQPVESAPGARTVSKKAQILELVQRPGGATLQELREATGWEAHSVRGFLSGVLGKQMGLTIVSAEGPDGGGAMRSRAEAPELFS